MNPPLIYMERIGFFFSSQLEMRIPISGSVGIRNYFSRCRSHVCCTFKGVIHQSEFLAAGLLRHRDHPYHVDDPLWQFLGIRLIYKVYSRQLVAWPNKLHIKSIKMQALRYEIAALDQPFKRHTVWLLGVQGRPLLYEYTIKSINSCCHNSCSEITYRCSLGILLSYGFNSVTNWILISIDCMSESEFRNAG